MVPTHVDPSWKTLKAATKINIEALFLLRLDKANYNTKQEAPFVVLSNGECFNTPKYLWKSGHECIQHLHRFRPPDIGKASLKAWLEAILESESPIQVGGESEGESQGEAASLSKMGEESEQTEEATPATPATLEQEAGMEVTLEQEVGMEATLQQEVFGPVLWECQPVAQQTRKQRKRNKEFVS